MHDVRLKGPKYGVQITREIVLFKVLVRVRRHDAAHQSTDLLELVIYDAPPFLMSLYHLLTH